MLARELGLLLLLVLPLAVIHDPRHGRIGLGGDLHEVEVLRVGVLAGLVRRLDPELRAVLVDQPDTGNADLVVDPLLPDDRPDRLEAGPTWPQRCVTKLLPSSWSNDKNRCKQRPT